MVKNRKSASQPNLKGNTAISFQLITKFDRVVFGGWNDNQKWKDNTPKTAVNRMLSNHASLYF